MRWFIAYIVGGDYDGQYVLVEAIDEDDARIELDVRFGSDFEEVDFFEPAFVFRDLGDI